MYETGLSTGGNTILSLISQRLPSMRPSEQKVASYLLYEGSRVADWSLESLASSADVSATAIIRMCQALGLRGFREFRRQWIADQASQGKPSELQDHPLSLAMDAIQETARLLKPADLTRAAQILRNSTKVIVCGYGGSGLLATMMAKSLMLIGMWAVSLTELDRDAADLPVDSNTAVLVVSHRGRNPNLRQFVKHCKAQGAPIIAMTSGTSSPLARLADTLLLTGAPIENKRRRLELVPARVVQVAVLQALTRACYEIQPIDGGVDHVGD